MKFRGHHNTDGRRRTQRGKRKDEVRHMARRLGVPYAPDVALSPSAREALGATADPTLPDGEIKDFNSGRSSGRDTREMKMQE